MLHRKLPSKLWSPDMAPGGFWEIITSLKRRRNSSQRFSLHVRVSSLTCSVTVVRVGLTVPVYMSVVGPERTPVTLQMTALPLTIPPSPNPSRPLAPQTPPPSLPTRQHTGRGNVRSSWHPHPQSCSPLGPRETRERQSLEVEHRFDLPRESQTRKKVHKNAIC